jgi:peptide/nickel transport system permease protein
LKAKLGYDQPLAIRFVNFITGAVRGDFGVSLKTSNPVMKDIMNYFPATMELALVAIITLSF